MSNPRPITKQDIAKHVIELEKKALDHLLKNINESFDSAINTLLNCKGHVIVSGMGKSSHIAKKIAATLASTGTPAFFVHPSEANHGDMGMVTEQNVLLAISNSGETAELIKLLQYSKSIGVTIIGISARPHSHLAKVADIHLNIGTQQEACLLGLAPTASTTASLALGDALAVACLHERGFTQKDFANRHPNGQLGKRLTVKVKDLMHPGENCPVVSPNDTLKTALLEMNEKRLGVTAIVNEKSQLIGLFTDGDCRRSLNSDVDIHQITIGSLMTKNAISTGSDTLASHALSTMQHYKVTALPVCDTNNQLQGILHLHDLLNAGIPAESNVHHNEKPYAKQLN